MQSLWMVVAAMFFALYAVCIKFASLEGIGSFEVLFYRSFFGLLIFYTVMRIKHVTVHTAHPIDHMIRSVVGVGAVMAGIYSISHLNVGLAMTLNYTSPLFIGCFTIGIMVSQHKGINWKLLSTLLLGFLGVVIMLSPTITPDEYFAAAVGLGAGFCTAVATTHSFLFRFDRYFEWFDRYVIGRRLYHADMGGSRCYFRFFDLFNVRSIFPHHCV